MAYKSRKILTKNNGQGDMEVEIVYKNGIFRRLFNLPERRCVYVGGSTVWRDKETLVRCGTFKESELVDVVKWCEYNKSYA